jgi:hypothetical protein
MPGSMPSMLVALLVASVCGGGLASPRSAQAARYEGFGATTRGGAGGPVVRVTNLQDSGPGSLREALARGDRTIVFDVGGEILLERRLEVNGPYVTIDGSTAPPPGITLRNHGLVIYGHRSAHDVIVTGLRIRDAAGDGITIAYGASSVVIDHVSIQGSADGNLDITMDSRDVTVSWSILAEPAASQKNMLIKYDAARVTLHHNLFTTSRQRNPQARVDDAGTRATETTLDMRNNLVWDWAGGYGTLVWYGPRANIVDNFYASPGGSRAEQAAAILVRDGGRAYVAGNVSGDRLGVDINTVGTETSPFPAPRVTTQPACSAAQAIVHEAGVRPVDEIDAFYLGLIVLPCAAPPPSPPPSPSGRPDLTLAALSLASGAEVGAAVRVEAITENIGTSATGASVLRFSLAGASEPSGGDVVLGTVTVPSLAPGEAVTSTVALALPATASAGSYVLIAESDATQVIAEDRETNNALAAPLRLVSPPTASADADLAVGVLSMPGRAAGGRTVQLRAWIRNVGTGSAPSSVARILLSGNEQDGHDVLLAIAPVPPLAPGKAALVEARATIPAGTAPGPRFLLITADGDDVVQETLEANNIKARLLIILD